MKIWEILKEENIGKKYVDEKRRKWEVTADPYNGSYDLVDDRLRRIDKGYALNRILQMDFTEVPKAVKFEEVLNMKILTVDYIKQEQHSTMAVIAYNDITGYRIINIKHIENVANVEQVMKICMQFYEKYNCDKLFFEK